MTKVFIFCLMMFSGVQFCFAQQNNEFRLVKEFYDQQRVNLLNAFKKEAQNHHDQMQLIAMEKDFSEFMTKMDSIQNVASIGALIKVKNREALDKFVQKDISEKPKISHKTSSEIPAEYPGGINELRKQLAELFYFDALMPEISKLSVNISFVVEKDGSITTVQAEGENSVFNRQAEIAMYMLPEKFSPAMLDGEKIRYHFRVPLTMNFK